METAARASGWASGVFPKIRVSGPGPRPGGPLVALARIGLYGAQESRWQPFFEPATATVRVNRPGAKYAHGGRSVVGLRPVFQEG